MIFGTLQRALEKITPNSPGMTVPKLNRRARLVGSCIQRKHVQSMPPCFRDSNGMCLQTIDIGRGCKASYRNSGGLG